MSSSRYTKHSNKERNGIEWKRYTPEFKLKVVLESIQRDTTQPDKLQTREAAPKRLKQQCATVMIGDVGLMHQHVQQEPIGIDEQMALAPFHAFPAIIASPPPF